MEDSMSLQPISKATIVCALAAFMAVPAIAAAQAQRVRIGGDVQEPKKIKDVKPVYPEEAQKAGVQGIVIIETVIGTDGSIIEAKVLRPVPMLERAAVDAVMQWKYTPTLLNGQPVELVMTVTVTFTLSKGDLQ